LIGSGRGEALKIGFSRDRYRKIFTETRGSLFGARIFLEPLRLSGVPITHNSRPRSVEGARVVDGEVYLEPFAVIDQLEAFDDMQLRRVGHIVTIVQERLVVETDGIDDQFIPSK
jgi:hypothetical protein